MPRGKPSESSFKLSLILGQTKHRLANSPDRQ